MASEDRDIPGVVAPPPLIYAAGLLLNALWPLLLLPVVLLVMQRGVITREEAYLRRRFGREYEE